MAVESEHVRADLIDCQDFPDLVQRYQVRGVPKIVMNEFTQLLGAQPEAVFLQAMLRAAGAEEPDGHAN